MNLNKFLSLLFIVTGFVTSIAQVSDTEREALKVFYNATGGENWINTQNDEQAWLIGDDASDISEWYGITLSEDGEHVERIELIENGLSGSLTISKNDFSELLVLNLNNNSISGQIPSELSGMLRLQEMDLGANNLTGEIPADLGSLLNLEKLDLSDNELTGTIPITFCTLGYESENNGLTYLSLANNNLEGSVTSSIAALTNLQEIDLSGNNFTGSFPSFVRAVSMDISSNQFSGSIPSTYASINTLTEFLFDNNNFVFSDFEDVPPLKQTVQIDIKYKKPEKARKHWC